MENLQNSLEIALGAVIAVLMAFFGSLTRLFHEHAHGIPITWIRVLALIPAAVIMGELGHALGEYLKVSYSFPPSTDHALAGVLGYLGPTIINEAFNTALQHVKDKLKGKPEGGAEGSAEDRKP